MKKNNVAILLLIFVLVAFSFYYAQNSTTNNILQIQTPFNFFKSESNPFSNLKLAEKNESIDAQEKLTMTISPEFKDWYTSEVRDLEKSTTNPDDTKKKLLIKSKSLTQVEIQFLTQQSIDIASTANDKIFSVYLLGMDAQHNNEGLIKIIIAPFNFAGTQTTHSPEETLAMQEKTIRRMAIDAIMDDLKDHPEQKPFAQAKIQEIQDTGVRDYALKRLREIP